MSVRYQLNMVGIEQLHPQLQIMYNYCIGMYRLRMQKSILDSIEVLEYMPKTVK